jgi:hypothetical protein
VKVSYYPQGDGNCQFESVQYELRKMGVQTTSTAFRKQITTFLETYDIKGFVPGGTQEAYLKNMQKPNTYGDHITLMAVSKLYQAQIVIISRQGAEYMSIIGPDGSANYDPVIPTILLGIIETKEDWEGDSSHFVSLQPMAGKTVADIVNTRRQEVSFNSTAVTAKFRSTGDLRREVTANSVDHLNTIPLYI